MSDEHDTELAETLRKMTALSNYAEICEAHASEVADSVDSGYPTIYVSVKDAKHHESRIRAVIAAEWRKIASEQVAEIARLAATLATNKQELCDE